MKTKIDRRQRIVKMLNEGKTFGRINNKTKANFKKIREIADSFTEEEKDLQPPTQVGSLLELKPTNFYQRQLAERLKIYSDFVGLPPHKLIFRLIEKELNRSGMMERLGGKVDFDDYED